MSGSVASDGAMADTDPPYPLDPSSVTEPSFVLVILATLTGVGGTRSLTLSSRDHPEKRINQ